MRTVQLHLTEEFLDAVGGLPDPEVSRCVGYLATWAIGSERHKGGTVTIGGDKDGNLSALYRNADGAVTYEIFGLRSDTGNYSTHS
jgi:hypothetical protein